MGCENRLPWRIPEDLRWFHEHTAGRTLILGRICYETWPAVHREGRRPIVITSRSAEALRPCPLPPDALPPLLARSVPEALALAGNQPDEIIVCGGERIFEETLPRCHRLYLTEVHADVEGDVYFPEWRHLPWKSIYRRDSEDAGFRLTFNILERLPSP
jgi:dihydrofolate reductase